MRRISGCVTLRDMARTLPSVAQPIRRCVGAALIALVACACQSSHSTALPAKVSASPPSPASVAASSASASQMPTSRSCNVHDLTVDFRGGGLGTGNDFATLVVRDISPNPCRLVGKAVIVPIDIKGKPIHTYFPINALAVPAGLTLSALSPSVPTGQTATDGRVRAALFLGGAERDDPRPPHGSCPAAVEITPASWRVQVVGGVLIVANHDPGRSDVSSLSACRAAFSEVSFEAM